MNMELHYLPLYLHVKKILETHIYINKNTLSITAIKIQEYRFVNAYT